MFTCPTTTYGYNYKSDNPPPSTPVLHTEFRFWVNNLPAPDARMREKLRAIHGWSSTACLLVVQRCLQTRLPCRENPNVCICVSQGREKALKCYVDPNPNAYSYVSREKKLSSRRFDRKICNPRFCAPSQRHSLAQVLDHSQSTITRKRTPRAKSKRREIHRPCFRASK